MVTKVDPQKKEEDDLSAGMSANSNGKSSAAFRTISEVADELDVAQHVLRFWESKFPQVRPLKRGGGRRYYRPEDVDLLRDIRVLLYQEGYTIKGAQKLLRLRRNKPAPLTAGKRAASRADAADKADVAASENAATETAGKAGEALNRPALMRLREELVAMRELLQKASLDEAETADP